MTKQQAEQAAQATLKLIHPQHRKHWTIRVHENIGWHFALDAIDGFFCLHQSQHSGKYWCLLSNSKYAHTGSCDWSSDSEFADPNKAIAHTLKLARKVTQATMQRIELAETVQA